MENWGGESSIRISFKHGMRSNKRRPAGFNLLRWASIMELVPWVDAVAAKSILLGVAHERTNIYVSNSIVDLLREFPRRIKLFRTFNIHFVESHHLQQNLMLQSLCKDITITTRDYLEIKTTCARD
jgi:hypothetical protein